MLDLDKPADGPAMVADRTHAVAGARRGNGASRLRVVGPFFVVQHVLFKPGGGCGGGDREGVAALPRGRRRAAGGARVVARDERGDGRPEVLRPARDVAARLA